MIAAIGRGRNDKIMTISAIPQGGTLGTYETTVFRFVYSASVPTLTKPGRPRSAEADLAIREATIDLLSRHGYADLTMSGVANAAGVSSATLYRRWRSKLELVIDVLRARAEEREVPDTGSLYSDLHAVVEGMVDVLTGSDHGSVLPGLIGEIMRNAELAKVFRSSLVAPRRAAWAELLDRALERGELRDGLDYDLVGDLLTGPLYARLLITGLPITKSVATPLTDLVFQAVASPRALKAAAAR
jgi:AcrR family transcriptional regulator